MLRLMATMQIERQTRNRPRLKLVRITRRSAGEQTRSSPPTRRDSERPWEGRTKSADQRGTRRALLAAPACNPAGYWCPELYDERRCHGKRLAADREGRVHRDARPASDAFSGA